MSLYLPWCVYLGVATLFSWLAWRTIWADATHRQARTPPVASTRRTSTVAVPMRNTPVMFGLNMVFYGGMASFEVTQSLGF